jgi:Na+/melibiose symporter-like transporter
VTEDRQEPLDTPVRVAYGFGLSAEGIKNNAFNVFLLFYYQQIVGLDSALCGVALFIAMMVDAVTDPTVGIWSDGFRSRLGRRHPFMYVASLPLSLCFFATFMPPPGLSQWMLFAWLTTFAVGTRFAMTLFVIPHQSLVPELTQDYDGRTALQSWRTVFAWLFGLINALLGYRVFLDATPEYPQGLLNPAGYVPFAIWGASAMLVATIASSLGTQRAALRAQPDPERFQTLKLWQLPKAIIEALASRSYRAVVIAGLTLWVAFGMTENLGNYLNTYFWGFTSADLSILLLVIIAASLIVLVVARPLSQRFGKKRVAIAAALMPVIIRPGTIVLRLLDLLPENGDPMLLKILCVTVFLEYAALIVAMTMIGAMIADVTDEHELRTGSRQEGLLFSANMLMAKASSGIGVLVAGFVLKAARLAENATPETVSPETVVRLGVFTATIAGIFYLGTIAFFRRYDLSRERHAGILVELGESRLGERAVATAGRRHD